MSNRIATFVTIVITIIWATSIVVGMVDHGYQIPFTVQSVFAIMVGYFYGNKILARRNHDKDTDG